MLPFGACGFIWSQNVTYPFVYKQNHQNNQKYVIEQVHIDRDQNYMVAIIRLKAVRN